MPMTQALLTGAVFLGGLQLIDAVVDYFPVTTRFQEVTAPGQ